MVRNDQFFTENATLTLKHYFSINTFINTYPKYFQSPLQLLLLKTFLSKLVPSPIFSSSRQMTLLALSTLKELSDHVTKKFEFNLPNGFIFTNTLKSDKIILTSRAGYLAN